MRILFIVDPLDSLGLAGDTTYALMLEAQRRGHEVWTCQVGHLGLEHLLPTKGVVGTTSGSHETAMPVVDGPVDPES